jgi:hypothetical protein
MNEKSLLVKLLRVKVILVSLIILFTATTAMAASVTFRWDPSEPTPDGYRVFARKIGQAYNYSRPDWEGSAATCTIDQIEEQTEYFFVARAFDGGMESADSNEVHYIPPATPLPPASDSTPPTWNGATTGIGLTADTATGGNVTVEFDTAIDGVDGTNLKFNVYYAPSGSWNHADWTSNSVVADVGVGAGSTFDHAVLAIGLNDNVSYTFGVRVEDQSGNEDANTGTLTATPTPRLGSMYDLMLSNSTNRSGSVLLEGVAVEGNVYVFVEPTADIDKVEFFIDGVLRKTENIAPYDLAGSADFGLAAPFDTQSLKDGLHTFSARITKTNGNSETIAADADVHNNEIQVLNPIIPDSSIYAQWVSAFQDRSNPDTLDGATLEGRIYVFVEPLTDIDKVEFFIDGVLRRTENIEPYDLAGSTDSGLAFPFDTQSLKDGLHTFSARITKTNGRRETIAADFWVVNSSS